MVGWHHRLDGREFPQAPGVGDGQGGLACCRPRGRRELDLTEWLKNNSLPEKRKKKNPCHPRIPISPQHDVNKQQNATKNVQRIRVEVDLERETERWSVVSGSL